MAARDMFYKIERDPKLVLGRQDRWATGLQGFRHRHCRRHHCRHGYCRHGYCRHRQVTCASWVCHRPARMRVRLVGPWRLTLLDPRLAPLHARADTLV